MKRQTVIATVTAVLLLPALLTACSGPPPGADEATASAAASSDDHGREIAECMRGKGYDMDDPQGDSLKLAPPAGADLDQWQRDLDACLPSSGPGAVPGAAQPLPGEEEAQREYASCVREHGFEDFPDGQAEQRDYHPADAATFEGISATCSEDAYAGVLERGGR